MTGKTALPPSETGYDAETVVRDLYVALLRREPDEPGWRAHTENLRTRGLPFVVRSIAESAEALHIQGLSGQTRLALTGNCNMPALAACLRAGGDVLPWWVADVTQRHTHGYTAALEAIERGGPDYLISQPIWGYEEIVSEPLRTRYGARFLTITTIYFRGLQPDLLYRDPAIAPVGSPLHGHHSSLVVACYLRGMSVADCIGRFNARTYERLGFFDMYAASAADLLAREQHVDIRFAEEFLRMTKERLTLFTVSHPTSIVFAALAARVAEAIGLTPRRFDPDSFPNHLEQSLIWPIYPEIREAHALPYETKLAYKQDSNFGGEWLGLEQAVAGFYAAYDRAGRDALARWFPDEAEMDV